MNHLTQLRDQIKTEALHLGFRHVGMAPTHPSPHYLAFKNWILAEKHAGMAYLARTDTLEKRANPDLILENCQTVICLAMPYPHPENPISSTPPGKGRIAAYARTKDYHQVIAEKLAKLEDFIRSQAGHQVNLKSYTDTGPILERAYAVEAGLGMVGKNGCLIIPGEGSDFFLAEILTDLALPVDPPFTHDLCKNCQRCLEACPTQCIHPERFVDANRCISYLTIEHKDVIPDELKPKIASWVFGCDICQMVCPHNHHADLQTTPLGEPILDEEIDLIALFSHGEPEFSAKFSQTPLSRAKRRGLLRNAAIVLGNQQHIQALPILKKALQQEDDPIIQDASRWAIDEIRTLEDAADEIEIQ